MHPTTTTTRRFISLLVVLLVAWLVCGAALAAETGQHPETMTKQVEVKVNYLLYLPADYGKEQGKKFPTILFLHGAGERGDDVNVVKKHGPPKLLEGKTDLPVKDFIVVSPQCAADKWWEPRDLITLLDEVSQKYAVD